MSFENPEFDKTFKDVEGASNPSGDFEDPNKNDATKFGENMQNPDLTTKNKKREEQPEENIPPTPEQYSLALNKAMEGPRKYQANNPEVLPISEQGPIAQEKAVTELQREGWPC